MNDPQGRGDRAVAVVGIAAILPDAPDEAGFWRNVREKRYSIGAVPAERWSAADYYDPDPAAPDKTYSKIGGWVRGFQFDWKRFHIPPRVAAQMDESQQWAVTIAEAALADYGHPRRPLDTERTGVVLGAAMGGELHDLTTLRICFPEFARALGSVSEFLELPGGVRQAILYTLTDQELSARVEELSVMQRIDRELNASLEVERAMRITLEWAMRQSSAEAGFIGILQEKGVRLMAQQGYGDSLAIYEKEALALDHPLLVEALASGQPQRSRLERR